MSDKIIPLFTSRAPKSSNHLSQALRFKADEWIFCSGQLPINPKTKEIPSGAAAQTEQVMKNLQAVLEDAGVSLDHVVKTTIFITNLTDSKDINSVYKTFFPNIPPTRSQVEVSGLALGALVEIECLAII